MPNIGVMQVFLARLLGVDLVAIPAPIQLLGMMLDVAIATAVVVGKRRGYGHDAEHGGNSQGYAEPVSWGAQAAVPLCRECHV